MVSNPENLNNLVTAGSLRPHQPQDWEIASHLERAKNLLHDAKLKDATLDGRYNNAYSAAHALAQAAFKLRGFRTTDSLADSTLKCNTLQGFHEHLVRGAETKAFSRLVFQSGYQSRITALTPDA